MRLAQYVRFTCVVPDLAERRREEALRWIIHAAAEGGVITDEKCVFETLMERENVQSTAIGNGVAIPHCFTDKISGLIIIVACSNRGIEFGSFDGAPTRIIFLLIGSRQEYSLHLKAFARIARLMKDTTFLQKITSSTSREDLDQVLKEEAEIA